MFTNKLFIYISHVRISHKVKGVLMRNFRHNIFIRRQKDIGRFSNLHSVPLRSTINKKNRKKLHQQAFLTLHIHSSCKNSRCSQRKQYMFTSQVVHARLTSSAPPLLQLFNWVLIGRSPLFTQEKSRPDISSFHWLLSHLFDDILLKSYQALRMAFMAVRNEWSMNHWIYDVTTKSGMPQFTYSHRGLWGNEFAFPCPCCLLPKSFLPGLATDDISSKNCTISTENIVRLSENSDKYYFLW